MAAGPDGRDVIVLVTGGICESSQAACFAWRQQIQQGTAHPRAFKSKADKMFVIVLFKSLCEQLIVRDL